MDIVSLGRTGLNVSRLCYGTLTIGPLQRAMTAQQGAKLLIYAREKGILFFDTAELYGTYAHLNLLLRQYPECVIATKCYAYDTATAEASFAKATAELGREYVDVFLLHEQESEHTIRGHHEALEYFLRRKEQGLIGAVGLSTHAVAAAKAALKYPEVQVVHPMLNLRGVGIQGGTREDMEAAVAALHGAGRGIYAMKALGGGHLIPDRQAALRYILSLDTVDAVAVGMQSQQEIDYNVALFEGLAPGEELEQAVGRTPRALMIHDWCQGCGRCVQRCRSQALRLHEGRAMVDGSKCTRCGYCAAVCPDFCIKVL